MLEKLKAKIAYERQSYRMSMEHLSRAKRESPELFVKGFWRMTDAERRAAVRAGKR